MEGGGGLSHFWVYEKTPGVFWVANSEVVISLVIKYEPLSDRPSPSLTFVSGAPGRYIIEKMKKIIYDPLV